MEASEQTVSAASERLSAAGCLAAREEAAELVAAAPDEAGLESFVHRRQQGEPLAWITGSVQFCGRPVSVDPGVYVPRRQSEELAYRAGAILAACGPGAVAADLCTGAGAVAVHLGTAAPGAVVVGVDLDPIAAACARRNGIPAVVGDLGRALRPGCLDLLTAVAPYVPTGSLALLPADVQRFEPRLALDGGGDGLDVVRRIVGEAARLLRPDGWLLLELGADQDAQLGPALRLAGFGRATSWTDEDGDLRGIAARRVRPSPAPRRG